MHALLLTAGLLGNVALGPMPGGPRSIAPVDDLDGDGVPDIVCGCPELVRSEPGAGSAWVFSGKDGRRLRTFETDRTGDAFGQSVAGWTDLDGDGFAEIVIAAPEEVRSSAAVRRTPSEGRPGHVHVYSGRTGNLLLRFTGARDGDRFGSELASDGDVDGDGRRDLVVGAPGCSSVYVYSGKDAALIWSVLDDSEADEFGAAVGIAGDLDHDGRAEVLVGAPGGVNSCAIVLAGSDHHELRRHVARERGSLEARVHTGCSVAGVGDVDGDGVADYAFGSERDGTNATGRARLVSGATGAELALLEGTEPILSTFGASLVGMGDVDGDGRPDVLVSDPADSIGDEMPRGQSPGSLQAFSGRTHARLWQRFGEQQLQCLGRSLSRVGDLDGDGIADAAARCVFGDTLCVLVSGRTGTVLGRIPRP